MTCYEVLNVISGFLNILVIFLIAKNGFNEWRMQKILSEQREIARNLLKNVFLLRKKIDFVRSPFITRGEIENGLKSAPTDRIPDDPTQKQILGEKLAYDIRWKEVAEIGSELETLKVEANVVLDLDVDTLFKGFNSIINDVWVAIMMFNYQNSKIGHNQTSDYYEKTNEKFEKTLYKGYSAIDGEEDQIDIRFEKEIGIIKQELKPFLILKGKK